MKNYLIIYSDCNMPMFFKTWVQEAENITEAASIFNRKHSMISFEIHQITLIS